jgi:hypothetical protein
MRLCLNLNKVSMGFFRFQIVSGPFRALQGTAAAHSWATYRTQPDD